jgi:hypothetical protein
MDSATEIVQNFNDELDSKKRAARSNAASSDVNYNNNSSAAIIDPLNQNIIIEDSPS